MKKHNGMCPHDIAILLKIATKGHNPWLMKDLAHELEISAGEISESISRSTFAGLIGNDKKSINKMALLDFLKYGLPYVYTQKPGAITRGIATAFSAAPLSQEIMYEDQVVWPYANGNMSGQAIDTLHVNSPKACLKDAHYYELMALIDALRIGKTRERNLGVIDKMEASC